MIILLSKDDKQVRAWPFYPNARIVKVNVDSEDLDYLVDTYIKDEK